ncbi:MULTISPECIES: hypothetical protein [Ramlibacter]|uniref:Uncharacterized protein n=1 Tax=Ramlibacter pinisoli TaxID=2682844 RepID=A0A6N8IX67_9BURK|nr:MULTISPECIES: hypothetical protein [Ramlibacter]MBA2961646.1 hypothetical protein [Ramlibacter sp. CGMCC 1.13660]MVQ31589.1 hypothetical protein [Ramlibacter pinisoli]
MNSTHTQHRPATDEAVSPFHWRRFTERPAEAQRPPTRRQLTARAQRVATAREQAERILAHRWSGAYSKA